MFNVHGMYKTTSEVQGAELTPCLLFSELPNRHLRQL